jgi:hypothetical protein
MDEKAPLPPDPANEKLLSCAAWSLSLILGGVVLTIILLILWATHG